MNVQQAGPCRLEGEWLVMPELNIAFNGMVLLGHGDRGEGWLIDTDLIQIGHKHKYELVIRDTVTPLKGGQLITFEGKDGGRLNGRLELGGEVKEMVDLNTVLESPKLRTELATDTPVPGGPWRQLLAAWVRLPGGTVDSRADEDELWTFPKGGERQLTEHFTVKVPDVEDPVVRIQFADGVSMRISIPPDASGLHKVSIKATFTGEAERKPEPGETVALDEVLLLYACVDQTAPEDFGRESASNGLRTLLPTRTFTASQLRRIAAAPGLTDPVTVCPPGAISIP
jgi:hypothetical protein